MLIVLNTVELSLLMDLFRVILKSEAVPRLADSV